MELLCYRVYIWWILSWLCQIFGRYLQSDCDNEQFHHQCIRVLIFTQLLKFVFCFHFSIRMGIWWYCFVLLVSSFFNNNEVKLFICLLTIYISCLMCLLTSSAHFFVGCPFSVSLPSSLPLFLCLNKYTFILE